MNIIRKILTLAAAILLLTMSIYCPLQADEAEEWEESGTVLLDKVTYDTKTRKMSVEITEVSGSIAHEYELYILTELDIIEAMGQFMSLGKLLKILGIMTVDMNDQTRITIRGNGVIVISDQEIYFGNNEEVQAGMKVYVGVESLDDNYNPSKSNLIEMTIVDGLNEQGAIQTQNNDIPADEPSPGDNNNEPAVQPDNGGASPILIIGGLGILLLGGAAAFYFLKKNRKPKNIDVPDRSSKKKTEEPEESDDFKPSLEDKTVVVCSENEDLIKTLKDRHYLVVTQCEEDGVEDAIIENEPDIFITDLKSEEKLDELLAKKKEFEDDDEKPEFALGLYVDDELLPKIEKRLIQLKDDKEISGYAPFSASAYNVLVKLILPILKPDLKSDASLENLGKVADLLGIPGVSTVVDTFIAGRDIKANLEESELGVSEGAAIIGDIASILGFDTVASVAGLVDDVDSIKAAFDEEAGANEGKYGILGAKDIVDVVKDLSDKN